MSTAADALGRIERLYSIARDRVKARVSENGKINARDPDLSRFFGRSGKTRRNVA